jgi:predicted DNA-binding transcriptional regulator AlpA
MSQRAPVRLEQLISGGRLAEELTPHEVAAMMTALAGVQLALANRILTAEPAVPPARPDASKLLKVDDVAALLGTAPRAIYSMSQRQDWRPFTVRLSRRHLRFDEAGLRRWIAQRADPNSWEARR